MYSQLNSEGGTIGKLVDQKKGNKYGL